MPRDSRVPLIRTDRIVHRSWRRSQAEKTALSYREAGYVVEVAKEPLRWSLRGLGKYAVLVAEKNR